jgi:RNA polymerase sigma-70 factor (ECF subfamily)
LIPAAGCIYLVKTQPCPIAAASRVIEHLPRGLAVLDGFDPPAGLADSYLCHAVLADLHRRCGHVEAAQHHREAAMAPASSPAVAAVLARRLKAV